MSRDRALLLTALSVLSLAMGVSLQRARLPRQLSATVSVSSPQTSGAQGWLRRSLTPVANPHPAATPQPARCRPYRVAATRDGRKVYVTLAGKEIQPESHVVVLDVARQRELGRIPVGCHPFGIALHPTGKWILVTNRYSNFLSVIDIRTDEVVSEIPVPFYCEDVVFTPDGSTAYVTNFAKHQVLAVDLTVDRDLLTGRMRNLGFDREAFFGERSEKEVSWTQCDDCGWGWPETRKKCPHCGSTTVNHRITRIPGRASGGLRAVIRSRCGNAGCHLYRSGGFYAGPDDDQIFRSAVTYSFANKPTRSPLLRATRSVRHGGWADAVDGRHHEGGVVFEDPETDPDYARLRAWIAGGTPGPGISVGSQPRDLLISPDGLSLFVANTGSGDISVVDLNTLRETRRIFTRSPVNDLLWVDGHLVLATLGVGSGHPKAHHPGRESLDRNHPEAEFTLFRDRKTGQPLPLAEQEPLGPYDHVDDTAQEKFRDITNDIVVLRPEAEHVAAYQASDIFTRYTSDSFEALPGDVQGDVPPPLTKVVGAFPEQIVRLDDRLYVTMSGTFQVQEWRVDLSAEPEARLIPGRIFSTGFKPMGVALAGSTLVVANHLSESVTCIDLDSGSSSEISLSHLSEPFPATDFERGEFFVQTSVFSVDQDQSCVHCHYRDTSDGRRWSVSQVMGQSRSGQERTGGSREVPDIRNLVDEVPFFLEGTLSIDEPLTMMMEHNPLVDFQGETPAGDFRDIFATADEEHRFARSADAIVVATGKAWQSAGVSLTDLIKRREVHFARIAERYLGRAYTIRDLQRMIGEYQAGEPRLLPNPIDPDEPMVAHGRALFMSPRVGCSGCHPPPTFTDKKRVFYTQNKAFPALVSPAPRDNVHSLLSPDWIDAINGFQRPWDPQDAGRVEEREGFFVAPSLRGLWARPPVLLHHGHALSLREVVCTPDHPALRHLVVAPRDTDRPQHRELGLNELNGLLDTHGTTSHLSIWDVECLVAFLNSIE